jgi:hypothetical protein
VDCTISAPGLDQMTVHHKGDANLSKWPSPGDVLPIVIDRANPQRFVVKWDRVPRGGAGGQQAQLGALQGLMQQHAVNLQAQPQEVRQAVATDLQAAGVPLDVGGTLQITDPAQVQATVEVLKKHGLLPPNATVD